MRISSLLMAASAQLADDGRVRTIFKLESRPERRVFRAWEREDRAKSVLEEFLPTKLLEGLRVRHVFSMMNAFSADVPVHTLKRLRHERVRGITEVTYSYMVRSFLMDSVPLIGASEVHSSYNGRGVRVAVLDTGVDPTHPLLSGRVKEAVSMLEEPPYDYSGHGTHVSGIIVGEGEVDGIYLRGVAPGAELVSVKVLGGNGVGRIDDVFAGIEYAVLESNADVLNLSLGRPPIYDAGDVVFPIGDERTIEESMNFIMISEKVYRMGRLMVMAAGNNGPDPRTLSVESCSPFVLGVGATDKRREVTDYSSRGPSWVKGVVKPDLVAPGGDLSENLRGGIVSALSSYLIDEAARKLAPVMFSEHLVSLEGTSMAAPHVAGSAALLYQAMRGRVEREAMAELARASLIVSAQDLGRSPWEQGAGFLNVPSALEALERGMKEGRGSILREASIKMERLAQRKEIVASYKQPESKEESSPLRDVAVFLGGLVAGSAALYAVQKLMGGRREAEEDARKALLKMREDLRVRLRRLRDSFARGEIDGETYRREKAAMEGKLRRIDELLSRIGGQSGIEA